MIKKILILVIVAAVLVLAVFVFSKRGLINKETQEVVPGSTASETLGGAISESIGTENPATNVPELNPFEAGANPYSDAYKNPFAE